MEISISTYQENIKKREEKRNISTQEQYDEPYNQVRKQKKSR